MMARVKTALFRVEECSRGSASGLIDKKRSGDENCGGDKRRIQRTYFVYIVDAMIKSIIMNANKVQKIASA